MKHFFIINPKAGKGDKVDGLIESIKAVAQESRAQFDIFVSQGLEHTKDYIKNVAAQRSGEVEFIACGGDGTLCETILAVMTLDESKREGVSVGVVPIGTGNDFVSNFENKDKFFDIKAQLSPTPYEIDLIKCNDMYSVNMVNVGFDSHVVCVKEKIGRRKWIPRKLSYIFSLVITLIKKPWLRVAISRDGTEKENRELLLTTMANGAFCGGGFRSNPDASLVDGKIDLLTIKNVGRLKFISLVGKYKKGEHVCDKLAHIVGNCKCSSVDLYFDRETPVSVDGEVAMEKELHLSVVRGALRLMLPEGIVPSIMPESDALEYSAV